MPFPGSTFQRRLFSLVLAVAAAPSVHAADSGWVDLRETVEETPLASPRTLMPSAVREGASEAPTAPATPSASTVPEAPAPLVPHGIVTVPVSERVQGLQTEPDAEDSDLILTESAAGVDPAVVLKAVDDAFAQPVQSEDATADQAVQAAGRVTAELINEPPVDPLEVALLAPEPDPLDDAVLALEAAYRARDLEKLESLRLLLDKHPLEAYFELWALSLRLERAPDRSDVNVEFVDFIERHHGEYVGERAAVDYLHAVGERINRTLFESIYTKLVWNSSDPVISAMRLLKELDASPENDSLLRDAKALYRDGKTSDKILRKLGDAVVRRDRTWAWGRVIVLLQKSAWEETKRALAFVPRPELPASVSELYEILDDPVGWYNRNRDSLAKRSTRLHVFASLRLAGAQPELAAVAAEFAERKASAFWRSLVWSTIAFRATTSFHPKAVEWYARAGTALSRQPLLVVNASSIQGWRARAALRAGNWYSLSSVIERMPRTMQEEEVWIYWRARAYEERGLKHQAAPLYERIAGNISFYGKLACDALQRPYAFPKTDPVELTSASRARWATDASIMRARTFYRLHLYREGHREWNWAMRPIRGKGAEYLALAEFAKEQLLVHRMINTSERAGNGAVRIEQRYPMPHASLIDRVSKAQEIPEAWVYGLIRQESRFIPAVSSVVGARGLMQIMPGTAAWIAGKIGLKDFNQTNLTELEVNLVLGSAYLRMLYDEFDQSFVLATAAYNAGPARARVWRRTVANTLDSAAFIETIPFFETRDYVKNVLSNMQTYSMRTGRPIKNFTGFIGRIEPGLSAATDLP